ncbi:glycosyltransferase family A protein [Mangrovibacterium sp.]|uniref:glycosyltransferase family A protein n=1 Tax=Mangrovibacterium sp. TaxID=1961364 RepID=UPI003562FA52
MTKKTPVLLIIFNRPNLAEKVLDVIRQYQPDQLYIASDGARKHIAGEEELVKKTRELVLGSVDWDCNVNTLFQDENLGCGPGPATAISWLFSHEQQGIILEDDCIPQPDFFEYCHYLLNKYADNHRVWLISGRSAYPNSKYFKDRDYIFSTQTETWGWATWKRSWDKFDPLMNTWPDFYKQGGFKNIQFSKVAGMYLNWRFKAHYKQANLKDHVWDFQFYFSMNANGGLGIIPAKNLIENVGYEGTHFSGITHSQKLKSQNGYKIQREPAVVLPDRNYEIHRFYDKIRIKLINFLTRKLRNAYTNTTGIIPIKKQR